MKIKLICNHLSSQERSKQLEKFIFKDKHNIEFVYNNEEKPDYYVIENHPFYNGQKQFYDPKKTIYMHYEPKSSRDRWEKWKKTENFLYDNKRNWNIPLFNINTYMSDFIHQKIIKKSINRRKISYITSDLVLLPGHKFRVNILPFIDNLTNFNIQPDIYGREKVGYFSKFKLKNYLGEINNREDGLLKYYYNMMAENCQEKDYFSEKILDPILCETLCFYWGCPNVKSYLHPKSYIDLDFTRPKMAIQTIVNSINNDEYSNRLKYIKMSKQKIIHELNPIGLLENIIEKL
jgi:hypothetical protein